MMNKNTSLSAAAYQQLLSQELGISSRKIKFTKKANNKTKTIDKSLAQSSETVFKKSIEKQVRNSLNLTLQNSVPLNWLVSKLTNIFVLARSQQDQMTKMQVLPNLCEILEKRENKHKHKEEIEESGEATNADKCSKYLNLAVKRRNLKFCPICLDYFTPFRPHISIAKCCTTVYHTKCLKSILLLASNNRQRNHDNSIETIENQKVQNKSLIIK